MSAFPIAVSDPLLGFSAEVAVKTTVVLAAGALAGILLRKAHPAARHRAWALSLLLAAAIPALVIALPSFYLPTVAVAVDSPVLATRVDAPSPAAAPHPAARIDRASAPAVSAAEPRRSATWITLAAILAGVWALGSIALFGRIALSLLRARRVARGARPIEIPEFAEARDELKIARSIRVLESDRVHVPMTAGTFRPVLIVPTGFAEWSSECRRLVLLHELAHVRRGDFVLNLASEAALALHWFQPLAWLAARRVREEAEVAADDVVIATGAVPSTYASHLLAIVQGVPARSSVPLMTVAMGANPIERRLRTILDPARRRGGWRARPAVLLLAVALTAVLAATRLGATPAGRASTRGSSHAQAVTAGAASADSADQVAALVARAVRAAASRAEHYVVHAHNAVWRQIHGTGHESTSHDAALTVSRKVSGESDDSEQGERAFERAQELHAAGEYDRASEQWEEAARLGYRKGTASYNLACAQARAGQTDRALDSLQRSIDAGFDPSDYLESDRDLASLRSDARFRALVEEYGSGDRKRSLAALARLEQAGSRDFDTWYDLGKELHAMGEYDGALRAWRRSAELDPGNANATYNIACAEALGGDPSGALRDLERAIGFGFVGADHLERDDDFDLLRSDERFTRLVDSARELELPDGAVSSWMGGWRTSPKEWREAKARYERQIEQHPDSGRAWSNLGFARLRLDEGKGAAEAFKTAFDKGYRPGPTAYNVACGYASIHDADRAFEWLGRALEAGFDDNGVLASDPDLDNLRDDPRFPKIERNHDAVKWVRETLERKSREHEQKVQEY